jgi:hypothetical protein
MAFPVFFVLLRAFVAWWLKRKEEFIAHRGTEFTKKKNFIDRFLKLHWISLFSLFYFVPSWLGG